PFFNNLVAVELTGTQISQLLEQQWPGAEADAGRVMQVSRNFSYAWDATKPRGSRVIGGSIKIDGVALEADKSYRVIVNNFMADGGDGLRVLKEGRNATAGPLLTDAFADYARKAENLTAPPGNRITRTDK